jgi:hypothetical protein
LKARRWRMAGLPICTVRTAVGFVAVPTPTVGCVVAVTKTIAADYFKKGGRGNWETWLGRLEW